MVVTDSAGKSLREGDRVIFTRRGSTKVARITAMKRGILTLKWQHQGEGRSCRMPARKTKKFVVEKKKQKKVKKKARAIADGMFVVGYTVQVIGKHRYKGRNGRIISTHHGGGVVEPYANVLMFAKPMFNSDTPRVVCPDIPLANLQVVEAE